MLAYGAEWSLYFRCCSKPWQNRLNQITPMGHRIKAFFDALIPDHAPISSSSPGCSISDSASFNSLGKLADDGPNMQDPVTHMGEPNGVPDIVAMWGCVPAGRSLSVSHLIALSLSFIHSLCLSQSQKYCQSQPVDGYSLVLFFDYSDIYEVRHGTGDLNRAQRWWTSVPG